MLVETSISLTFNIVKERRNDVEKKKVCEYLAKENLVMLV